MKDFNNYIIEKLHLNKDTKTDIPFDEKADNLVKILGDKLIRSMYQHSKHIMWIKYNKENASIEIQIHNAAKRKECYDICNYIKWLFQVNHDLKNNYNKPKLNTIHFNSDTWGIDLNLFDLID